jgi:NADH-quinone oxidoreductase subunit A
MLFEYANVLVGLIFGAIFVVLNISVINRILAPKVKDQAKESIYECGEPAIGSAWVRFDMRFYTVALVFLIFEVEAAVMFPWAVVFKRMRDWGAAEGNGLFVFGEILLFLAILAVGLVYVWKKGDLDWVKSTLSSKRLEEAEAGRKALGTEASR